MFYRLTVAATLAVLASLAASAPAAAPMEPPCIVDQPNPAVTVYCPIDWP